MTVKFSLWKSGKKGELLGGEIAGEGGVWDKAGASAYEAIKYGRAVGGSGSNAYISCFVTGIRTNSTVAGQAWTRTSSNNNNVYNPNCKYSGYVYASASVGGTGCGSSHSDTGKIEHSFGLKGCTSSKLVKTVHIYNDKVHGNYSTTLSVDSQ